MFVDVRRFGFISFTGLLQGPGQGQAPGGAHHRQGQDLQQARGAEDPGSRGRVPPLRLDFCRLSREERAAAESQLLLLLPSTFTLVARFLVIAESLRQKSARWLSFPLVRNLGRHVSPKVIRGRCIAREN